MPASAVLVAVVVATWPVLAWPLRARFGTRAGIVPPLASLALLPFVVLGALWARAQPVVDAMPFRCGTGDVALLFLAVPLAGAALVFGTFWARYVASPPGKQRADATLRLVAVLAVAGGAALSAPAVFQSMRAPDADGWVSSLPRADDVPPEVRSIAFDRFAWSFYDVRRDEARDLWVVTQPGREGRTAVMALGCALVPRTILPRDLRGLAAPRGWVLEAAGGVMVASLAIAMARMLARRHVRRRSGIPAMHLGGGWIAVDEASPLLLATEMVDAEPGPVLVRLEGAGTASYRASGVPFAARVVARGTLGSVEETARSIATVGYAAALAVVTLSCAPLAIS